MGKIVLQFTIFSIENFELFFKKLNVNHEQIEFLNDDWNWLLELQNMKKKVWWGYHIKNKFQENCTICRIKYIALNNLI